ncbi:hypothetical protein Slin14017_G126800 [Septoria linicola]|nr:hypothetical protein Slin14017_G126800 [Septoria linicola]
MADPWLFLAALTSKPGRALLVEEMIVTNFVTARPSWKHEDWYEPDRPEKDSAEADSNDVDKDASVSMHEFYLKGRGIPSAINAKDARFEKRLSTLQSLLCAAPVPSSLKSELKDRLRLCINRKKMEGIVEILLSLLLLACKNIKRIDMATCPDFAAEAILPRALQLCSKHVEDLTVRKGDHSQCIETVELLELFQHPFLRTITMMDEPIKPTPDYWFILSRRLPLRQYRDDELASCHAFTSIELIDCQLTSLEMRPSNRSELRDVGQYGQVLRRFGCSLQHLVFDGGDCDPYEYDPHQGYRDPETVGGLGGLCGLTQLRCLTSTAWTLRGSGIQSSLPHLADLLPQDLRKLVLLPWTTRDSGEKVDMGEEMVHLRSRLDSWSSKWRSTSRNVGRS